MKPRLKNEECGGPCVKDLSLEFHKRPSPSPWVVTQRKTCGLGPITPSSGLRQAGGWSPMV